MKATTNILSRQSWALNRGGPAARGLDKGITSPNRKNNAQGLGISEKNTQRVL